LSGNVLEWTRSLWGEYPYPLERVARSKRGDLQALAAETRVLRGGACWDARENVRCASRDRWGALGVSGYVGFRVALVGPP